MCIIKGQMSIYSGFPTRKDESNYNQLLTRLLQLMQSHILQLLETQQCSNTKFLSYSRIYSKMQQYQQHKYLPPKFSEVITPLAEYIGIPVQSNRSKNLTGTNVSPKHLPGKGSTNSLSKIKRKEKEMVLQLESAHRPQFKVRQREVVKLAEMGIKGKQRKFHESFYEIHERKISKMNQRYNQKVYQRNKNYEGTIGMIKFNYRSRTEPSQGCEGVKGSIYQTPPPKRPLYQLKSKQPFQDPSSQICSLHDDL